MVTILLLFFIALQFIVIAFMALTVKTYRDHIEYLDAERFYNPILADAEIPAFLRPQAD